MKQYLHMKMVGIAEDLPAEDVPEDMWSDGINVYNREQSMRRVGGYDEYAEANWPAGLKPVFILPVETPVFAYWIYVADNAGAVVIYVTDGTTHWNITPTTPPTDIRIGYWTGDLLNGVPVLNNGVDPPWWWDGQTSNAMTVLPDWPAGQACRALRSFKYHLFALGVTRGGTEYPDLVVWSDSAEPGAIPSSWTPGPGTDAGEVTLGDTQGGVIDGGKLRDGFIIYKNYSTTYCTYIGGNFVFSFRDTPAITHGIQSQNCIAEDGGYAYIFTGDDFVRHDGQRSDSVCTDKIRLSLVGRVDPNKFHEAVVTSRHLTDEVWVAIPVLDQEYLTLAFVYNTRTGNWGKRSLPGVTHIEFGIVGNEGAISDWDSDSESWDSDETRWDEAAYSESANELLMTDYSGQRLLIVDRIDNNAGVDLEASLVRESYPIGTATRNLTVTEIWPHIDGDVGQTFTVRLGGQLNYGDQISWCPPMTYTIGQQPNKVDCFAVGKYVSVSFESKGGKAWRHYGQDLLLSDSGKF